MENEIQAGQKIRWTPTDAPHVRRYGVFRFYDYVGGYAVVQFEDDPPGDEKCFPIDEIWHCSLLERLAFEVEAADRYDEA